jgi:hypothetical protein
MPNFVHDNFPSNITLSGLLLEKYHPEVIPEPTTVAKQMSKIEEMLKVGIKIMPHLIVGGAEVHATASYAGKGGGGGARRYRLDFLEVVQEEAEEGEDNDKVRWVGQAVGILVVMGGNDGAADYLVVLRDLAPACGTVLHDKTPMLDGTIRRNLREAHHALWRWRNEPGKKRGSPGHKNRAGEYKQYAYNLVDVQSLLLNSFLSFTADFDAWPVDRGPRGD